MTTPPTKSYVRSLSAGRELDALVHSLVLGKVMYGHPDLGWLDHEEMLCYSSNWSAAGPLLESCPEGFTMFIDLEDSDVTIETKRTDWMTSHTPKFYEVVTFDRTKPNDLCRAIAIAVLLAALATRTTEGG